MMVLSKEEILEAKSKFSKVPLYREGKPPLTAFDIDFTSDIEETWGRKWGGASSYSKLRAVIMQRPGPEAFPKEAEIDPQFFSLPAGFPNIERMQKQWDDLAKIFTDNGIEIFDLGAEQPVHGTYGFPLRCITYCHETLPVPGGAIICRCAAAFKRGEETYHAKLLGRIGCPTLYTIHGKGFFESSNAVWLDEKSIALALSQRSNQEGIDQIIPVLKKAGVEDIHIVYLTGPLNKRTAQVGGGGGSFHLDMSFGVAAPKLGVIYPPCVNYQFIDYLINTKGFDLIEIPDEEVNNCASNFLVLEPGKLIMPAGNKYVTSELKKRGIEVIETDLSEFTAIGGGGPTCLTTPLIRDYN